MAEPNLMSRDPSTLLRSAQDDSESFRSNLTATNARLRHLLKKIEATDRVGIDTEADSLHSYREKLCLIQISVPSAVTACRDDDFVVDSLSNLDLEPLRHALESREIVLHAADYDLRMLRRGLNFKASKIFDTVIAARLLGIREFSLGALVKRFFDVELHKHSQKANWALRPLPTRMLKYAIDDVHYLLPLAARLEEELEQVHRRLAEAGVTLATLHASAPVGLGFVDRQFRLVHLNEMLAGINGSTVEEQHGKTVEEVRWLFDRFHDSMTGKSACQGADAGALDKLTVLSGVREYPMRVKCATLSWHTLMAALYHKQAPVSTEGSDRP